MLTTRQKVSYGICRLGTSLLLNIVTVFTFWAYKDIFVIPAELSGIGNATGKIAIAISGFVFGYLSDVIDPSKRKLGRRKFFIWTGAPLLAFSFIMLFTPHLFIPVEQEIMRFVWLIIWNSMFHLFYGYLLMPYQAWYVEITNDDERIGVSAIQNISNLIASLVGAGYILFISDFYGETTKIEGTSGIWLLVFAIVFAIVEVALFLPALLTIKEKPVKFVKRNIWKEIKITLKNRNYVIYMISFSIMWVGVIYVTAMLLDFINIILEFDTNAETLPFVATLFVSTILAYLFWTPIGNKIGKKKALAISYGVLIVWIPLTPLIGKIAFIPLAVQGYLYGIVAVFFIAPSFLLPYAIIGDLADKDERDTSLNRAGLYTGFKNIPINIGQAAGYIMAGFLSILPNNFGLKWLGPISVVFLIAGLPIFLLGNFDPFMKKEEISKNEEITKNKKD